jgi:diaminohydroxyphosphoribosylaminopyrimidine deaminase / 5-amino-6-(5-phosphoribosylamino)uracil reductase
VDAVLIGGGLLDPCEAMAVTDRAEDERFMRRALELAARGQGSVEPNPTVGCVIVRDGKIVGEGWHEEFGGPHAEIVALQKVDKSVLRGATAYVTLEPCCHQGKTPPCSKALVIAGIARVVAAMEDPFPSVDGGGIDELRAAGVECEIGLLADEARELNAPYLMRINNGRPWVIAKWAQTRDGKMAMADGTRWISNERSRELVQQLRGRVDAIIVGSGTALTDDPLLTARPKNPTEVKRTALRVVVDSRASLPLTSQLVRTAREVPTLVAVSDAATDDAVRQLHAEGVQVFYCEGATHGERLKSLLDELGRRRMTNVLVEGGSRLLHALFDIYVIDEVHVFTAPKDAGGDAAPAPRLRKQPLKDVVTTDLDGDEYLRERIGP